SQQKEIGRRQARGCIMAVTRSQVFKLGNLVLGAFTGAGGTTLLSAYHLDASTIAAITTTVGGILLVWNGPALILDDATTQVQAAAANDNPAVQKALAAAAVAQINSPNVKSTLVQGVSQLPGVDPLKINAKATPDLQQLAASEAPVNQKIEKAA